MSIAAIHIVVVVKEPLISRCKHGEINAKAPRLAESQSSVVRAAAYNSRLLLPSKAQAQETSFTLTQTPIHSTSNIKTARNFQRSPQPAPPQFLQI